MLSPWLRAIRVRFLLASVIAVCTGLALSWWHGSPVGLADAALILAGVLALHASVDLLNDFWDFKRGIDSRARRTKMSGGTGVLPEGLLRPSSVYRAGIAFLVIGSAIGSYFVVTHGVTIAAILGFAVLSIYFYSTRIVNYGLGELFVAIKGAMIVIGTFFIQSGLITAESALAGAAVGSLSSLVLFVASFPDYDADRSGGRRTLVIMVGKKGAVRLFWAFPLVSYGCVLAGVCAGMFPLTSAAAFLGVPLLIKSWRDLAGNYGGNGGGGGGDAGGDVGGDADADADAGKDRADALVPAMSMALASSRVTGALFVAGLLVGRAAAV